MSKFKVGDRVRLVGKYWCSSAEDQTPVIGTVEATGPGPYRYEIMWDLGLIASWYRAESLRPLEDSPA